MQHGAAAAAASTAAQCPYVHYTAPGRMQSHDTAVGSGACPVFEDAASWGLVRSPAVEQALAQQHLQVGSTTTTQSFSRFGWGRQINPVWCGLSGSAALQLQPVTQD